MRFTFSVNPIDERLSDELQPRYGTYQSEGRLHVRFGAPSAIQFTGNLRRH